MREDLLQNPGVCILSVKGSSQNQELGDPPDRGREETKQLPIHMRLEMEGDQIRPFRLSTSEDGSGQKESYKLDRSLPTSSQILCSNKHNSTSLANHQGKSGKAAVQEHEEVVSCDHGESGNRKLLRGSSSKANGRATREDQGAGVVVLDLSRERAMMRTRWLAVGLFFLMQAFSAASLFKELKDKWGMRDRLHYTQLKNNMYMLEFEREGDLRFILNNGPWTHRGDAFLIVRVDDTIAPGEVEIAHMPIWAQIYDVPPLMLSKEVGEKLGAILGEVLEVDTDKGGRIHNEFIRVRVKHDVDEPLSRNIKTRVLAESGEEEK